MTSRPTNKKHKWAMCATVSGCTEGNKIHFLCLYIYFYTQTHSVKTCYDRVPWMYHICRYVY